MKTLTEFIRSQDSELKSPFIIPNKAISESFIENDHFLKLIYQANPIIDFKDIPLKETIVSDFYFDEMFTFHIDDKVWELKKKILFIREQYYIENKKELDSYQDWIGDLQSLNDQNPYLFIAVYNQIYQDIVVKQLPDFNFELAKVRLKTIYFAKFDYTSISTDGRNETFEEGYRSIYKGKTCNKFIPLDHFLRFGKYSESSLIDIYESDAGYISWIINNMDSYAIAEFDKLYLFDKRSNSNMFDISDLITNNFKYLRHIYNFEINEIRRDEWDDYRRDEGDRDPDDIGGW